MGCLYQGEYYEIKFLTIYNFYPEKDIWNVFRFCICGSSRAFWSPLCIFLYCM